jgi:hypothetical protein
LTAEEAAAARAAEDIANRDALEPAAEVVDGGEGNQPAPVGDPKDDNAPVRTEKQRPQFEDENDAARAAIFANADRVRNRTPGLEAEGEEAEAGAALGAGADADKTGTAAEAAKPAKVTLADDAIVTVKVNGVDRDMTFAEARREIGMSLAAQDRLESAKRLEDEARRDRREAMDLLAKARNSGEPAGSDATPARTDGAPKPGPSDPDRVTKLDPARLADIADRIQAGTREEAAEALADALATVGNAQATPADAIGSAVRDVLEQNARREEVKRALAAVAESYPDLTKETLLFQPVYSTIVESVVKDLRAIGVPEEDFNQPAATIIEGYQKLRADPQYAPKLTRDLVTIAKDAAKVVDDRFLAPTRAAKPAADHTTRVAVSPERTVRKETRVIQQPRSATRTDLTETGKAPAYNRSAIVGGMAEARGQASAG